MLTKHYVTMLGAACLALSVGYGSDGALAQQPAKPQANKEAKQAAQPAPQQPALKQIALTEQHINQLVAAQKEVEELTAKLPEGPKAKPDPKLTAQIEDTVKKHGFASFAEYNDIADNVGLVLSGVDPKTKAYVGPEAVIKAQIAELQADKKMPAKEKKAALAELNAALKSPGPAVENKANIDLVVANYDKLVGAQGGEAAPAAAAPAQAAPAQAAPAQPAPAQAAPAPAAPAPASK